MNEFSITQAGIELD